LNSKINFKVLERNLKVGVVCSSCEAEGRGFNYVEIPFGDIDLFIFLCNKCLKKSNL